MMYLVYLQMVGGLLPTVIKTGAKIGFAANVLRKLSKSASVDVNVIFAAKELSEFRKTSSVRRRVNFMLWLPHAGRTTRATRSASTASAHVLPSSSTASTAR